MSNIIKAQEAREIALKVHAGCEEKCKTLVMGQIQRASARGELSCVLFLDEFKCASSSSVCHLDRLNYEPILKFLGDLDFSVDLNTESSNAAHMEIRW